MLRRLPRAVIMLALATVVAASALTAVAPTAEAATPRLTVTRVVSNLSVPWDVTWVGSLMLFDQRSGGVWSKRGSAAPRPISMPLPNIYATGEAGAGRGRRPEGVDPTSTSTPAWPWPTPTARPRTSRCGSGGSPPTPRRSR